MQAFGETALHFEPDGESLKVVADGVSDGWLSGGEDAPRQGGLALEAVVYGGHSDACFGSDHFDRRGVVAELPEEGHGSVEDSRLAAAPTCGDGPLMPFAGRAPAAGSLCHAAK
jgi:hypothetical protein